MEMGNINLVWHFDGRSLYSWKPLKMVNPIHCHKMQCGKVTVGSISLIQGKVALFMPGGTEKKVNLLERCK
jgi:hypothetical protein